MQELMEEHVINHNGLSIDVKILRRGGVYVPMSFIVYKGSQAINHRLSDKMVQNIEGIIADYCDNLNRDIN